MKHLLLTGVAALAFATSAHAADIKAVHEGLGYTIYVSGKILIEDADKFAAIIEDIQGSTGALVVLDSPGGNVIGGLGIAYQIHDAGFSTWVRDGSECASMCAYIWLAGKTRWADQHAHIGFHTTSYEVIKGRKVQRIRAVFGNAFIYAYCNSLGLSDKAINYLLAPGPDDVAWLTAVKAKELGIEAKTFVPEPEPQLPGRTTTETDSGRTTRFTGS